MIITSTTLKDKQTFDKQLLKKRFGSAISTYNAHARVQQQMAIKLVKMAKKVLPANQNKTLEIGCGTGLLTEQIIKEFKIDSFVCNDLLDDVSVNINTILNSKVSQHSFIAGDAEQLVFPSMQDSIWSGATIQWVSQLSHFFNKLSAILKPEGYLVLSSFGPVNYSEIKDLTGSGIHYQSKEEIIEAARNDFELICFDEWIEQVWFEQPSDVLRHMRYTGVNGVSHSKWTKGKMQTYVEGYQHYWQSQGYPLSYHPYLMIFKKK